MDVLEFTLGIVLESYMDTPSILIHCRGVHPVLSTVANVVLKGRLAVFLTGVVDKQDDLQAVMRDTDAVLGGAAAFAFLLDMNIPEPYAFYVQEQGSEALLAYFRSEGFVRYGEQIPLDHNSDYCHVSPLTAFAGISRVCLLRRGTVQINVFITGTPAFPSSPSVPIAFSSSTALINSISPDGICCAYPELTLYKRSLVLLNRLARNPAEGDILANLTDHGLDVRSLPGAWDHDKNGLPRPCNRSRLSSCRIRWFGDRGCLVAQNNFTPCCRDWHAECGPETAATWNEEYSRPSCPAVSAVPRE
ncbi:hypothetical protein C8Q76DRAFT_798807 [Earliella scabrosa]|nr:hypothetical protein C8Q76DRAFT_798807 [Earliella scabrosa]